MSHPQANSTSLSITAIWMLLCTSLALAVVISVVLLEYQVVIERGLANTSYLPTIQAVLRELRTLRGQ